MSWWSGRHTAYLAHLALLERELEFHKTAALHERARAEVAVSELLRLKLGTTALHPLEVPEPGAQRAATVEELLRTPDFIGAGGVE